MKKSEDLAKVAFLFTPDSCIPDMNLSLARCGRWVLWNLLALMSVLAEGTFNANNNFVPSGATQKAFVLDTDGTPLQAGRGRVEFVLLPSLVTLSPGGASGEALTLDGLFFVNGLVVPPANVGDGVDILVRAWDAMTGDTYEQAFSKAETIVRVSNLGGGLTPPATFGENSDFRGMRLQLTPYSVVYFSNGVFDTNRMVLGVDGAPLASGSYVARLFMDTRTGLVAVNGKGDGRFATPGIWGGGLRELAGVGYGQTVQLEVRVWDLSLYSSYEAAVNAGGMTGSSGLFNYTFAPSGPLSGPSSWMSNLTSIRLRTGPTPPPLIEGISNVDPVEGETVVVEPKVSGGTAPLTYLWQLPNGVQSTSRLVTFPGAGLRPGVIDFNLTVTDAEGRSTVPAAFRLDVSNRVPVIRSAVATGAVEGELVEVSAAADYAWPSRAVQALWTLPDGRRVQGLTALLPLLSPGRHRAELVVSELGLLPVYDSLDSVGSPAGYHLASEETGAEVVLTRTNDTLHEVSFSYFADLSGMSVAERAAAGGRLRLYRNDGPEYPGSASRMPQTLLYESPVFGINSGLFLQRLTEVNIKVVDRLTWTVVWTNVNQTAGRTVGLVLSEPGVNPSPSNRGSSPGGYWVHAPERWELRQFEGSRPTATFASRATAIGSEVVASSLPWPVAFEVTNVPPTLESLAVPAELVAGQSGDFRAVATDPGSEALTYSWDFGDASTATGAQVSHAYATVGTFKGTLRVSDAHGGVVTAPFAVTTTVERRPLGFVGTPPLEVTQGQPYLATIAANPPGIGQTITLKPKVLPGWLTWTSVSPAEGRLEGIPGQAAVGANPVVIESTDGVTTENLEFVIVVADVNEPPAIQVASTLSVPVRKGISGVPVVLSDPDGPNGLVVAASSSDTAILPNERLVVGGEGANRTLSILPSSGAGGLVTVTLTVSDGVLTASAGVAVTLVEPQKFTVRIADAIAGGVLSLSPATNVYEEAFPLVVTAVPNPGWALRRWLGFPGGPIDADGLERVWRVETNAVLSGEFVDVSPPVVDWITPKAGLSATDVVTLSGQVRDNDQVASALLIRDGLAPQQLALTAGRFQVEGVRLAEGENRFAVEARDVAGNSTTNDLVVIWSAGSVLVVGDAVDAREGQRVAFPIQLQNQSALSGLTFNLLYNDYVEFLAEPAFEPGSLLPSGLITVNTEVPGVVRVTLAAAGESLPAGRHTLGTLSFRVRSLFSPIGLQAYVDPELLEVSNDQGDPVAGVAGIPGQVRLLPRRVIGDLNGNERLDVGDAGLLQRLVVGLDAKRSWDVALNDLNKNGSLDSGDVVRVMRVVIGQDPQPAPRNAGVPWPGPRRLARAGNESDWLEMTPSLLTAKRGGLFEVQVRSKRNLTDLRGLSFELIYPPQLISLVTPSGYGTGPSLPADLQTYWGNQPVEGRLRFGVSSATNRVVPGGVIARFTFRVGATVPANWQGEFALKNVEFTGDGYTLLTETLSPGAVALSGEVLAPVVKRLRLNSGGSVQLDVLANPGSTLVVEAASNLHETSRVVWRPVLSRIYDQLPLFVPGDSVGGETAPFQYFRVRTGTPAVVVGP